MVGGPRQWRARRRRRDAVDATATIIDPLAFPTEIAPAMFLGRATACRFRPTDGPGATSTGGEVAVELARDTAVDAAAVHETERCLLAEAARWRREPTVAGAG